ncbi:MAG: hypothetical protein ACREHC_02845 [Candidatus Levyibacteriota bacterium]
MNNKILLESMALDLKRVALGSYSKSTKMADRFLQEVFKRNEQLDYQSLPESLRKILLTMQKSFEQTNRQRLADDALMYSTLLLSFSKRI